ncbi:hypothetical protein [Pectobacterium wasabiae]|uniref:Peptidoglycan-binding domain-containing protein n=1 Tax=Pectobacterium wasabiae TaxID=55208 RepID=A0AAW3EJJ1_9GAMM|nr:hypothetical protein [Pectobacterium wasabiae]AOR61809.1 peptidoglycan-binding domain-containing protein [Pectobacterium wasabiae CFBP 3304]EJS95136.1 Hypothetical protein Y17_1346 [Pectobacterium wasabiae CFBP 3304]KFX08091.1 peptidoglycan-binding domain-containing protein [Pectobacterium wasabiae]KGA30726.1 peptidoglycan-binding domain-containing protein [Pectobacterium wasabiae]
MLRRSGPDWVRLYPGSASIQDLRSPFRTSVERFIAALQASNAQVTISATLRPPERAYLMHWSWMIAQGRAQAESATPMVGVNIQWVHPTPAESVRAAAAMVNAYGMSRLNVAPALRSRHTEGHAIDMDISWRGELTIQDSGGNNINIRTQPATGMNTELHRVGASYGVIKFHGGERDRPHWSIDGR